MKYIVSLLILLMSSTALGGWDYLERETLHDNPLAHPRSPCLGLSLNTSKYQGHQVVYFDAIIGGQVGIVSYNQGFDWAAQLGAEAGGWLTLGHMSGTSFAMLTEDFIVSFPLSFRYKKLSAAVKWNHISAHLGDGMSKLLEDELDGQEKEDFEFYEDLAEDNDMDLNVVEPFAYSRDFISWLLSYEFTAWSREFRVYHHGGYVYKIHPDNLGPWYLGTGVEVKWWQERHSPYTALDLTWNQDTSSLDVSGQVGWLVKPDWDSFTFFVAINGFMGQDRRGQLHGERLDRLGIGFFVR